MDIVKKESTKIIFSSTRHGQEGWFVTVFDDKVDDDTRRMGLSKTADKNSFFRLEEQPDKTSHIVSANPDTDGWKLVISKTERDLTSRWVYLKKNPAPEEIAVFGYERQNFVSKVGKTKGWLLSGRRVYDEDKKDENNTFLAVHKEVKHTDAEWQMGEKIVYNHQKIGTIVHITDAYDQRNWVLGSNANEKFDDDTYKVVLKKEGKQKWTIKEVEKDVFNILLNDPDSAQNGWKMTVLTNERDSASYWVVLRKNDGEGQKWKWVGTHLMSVDSTSATGFHFASHRCGDADNVDDSSTRTMVHRDVEKEAMEWEFKEVTEEEKKPEPEPQVQAPANNVEPEESSEEMGGLFG